MQLRTQVLCQARSLSLTHAFGALSIEKLVIASDIHGSGPAGSLWPCIARQAPYESDQLQDLLKTLLHQLCRLGPVAFSNNTQHDLSKCQYAQVQSKPKTKCFDDGLSNLWANWNMAALKEH